MQKTGKFSPNTVILDPPIIGAIVGLMEINLVEDKTTADTLFVSNLSGNLKNTETVPRAKNGVMTGTSK